MTLAASVNDYVNRLMELGTALDKLRQMVDVDDVNSPHLVEEIHAETLEVIGLQVSCLEMAQQALALIEGQQRLELVWRLLSGSNQSVMKMSERFYESLSTPHRMIDLERLKRRSDGEWARITQNDLHSCQIAVQNVCAALLSCWQNYSEAVIAKAPTLHSTSIGQQFTFLEQK
jgi:hypothetical protein